MYCFYISIFVFAWQHADMLRSRLSCLAHMSRLAKRVQNLLLSGTLVLSSLGCSVLRERCYSTIAAFPEQRLRFGYSARNGRVILIEPEEQNTPPPQAPLAPAGNNLLSGAAMFSMTAAAPVAKTVGASQTEGHG